MLPAYLLFHILLLLLPLAFSSSLLNLAPLSSNLTLPTSNLTTRMNRVICNRHLDRRSPSDYATCIPSLFRMYTAPLLHAPVLWVPGDFKQWGPETDLGGCYILVDGGAELDVFAIETLLGPTMWALGKCFLGDAEGRNRLAKTRIGPRKQWWLSVVLEVVGSNASVS